MLAGRVGAGRRGPAPATGIRGFGLADGAELRQDAIHCARDALNDISYSQAPYPVRGDFAASHSRYWARLAAPGDWLTGRQRVEVAAEVRQAPQCALCRRRKEALSPYQVDGAHEAATGLPEVMVEVVHRVVTDSARLTKSWFDGVMRQGLSEEQYVEIIGTVVSVFSIDEFCRGLGLPLNELPEARPGEPKGYRPEAAVDAGAWVPLLPPVVAGTPDADLWEGAMSGFVIRALGLVPDEVRTLLDLNDAHYLEVDKVWNVTRSPQGTLSRMQTEVIAARVSALNGCFY